MRTIQITAEAPFQIANAHSFAVSNSESGYTLMYSADGYNYTAWSEATPANETLIVNSIANGMFFYFSGNTSTVTVVY